MLVSCMSTLTSSQEGHCCASPPELLLQFKRTHLRECLLLGGGVCHRVFRACGWRQRRRSQRFTLTLPLVHYSISSNHGGAAACSRNGRASGDESAWRNAFPSPCQDSVAPLLSVRLSSASQARYTSDSRRQRRVKCKTVKQRTDDADPATGALVRPLRRRAASCDFLLIACVPQERD